MLGFIGLGAMGSRMATRLVEAGHPLSVYNRTPQRAGALAERGARVYDAPADLARAADVVLSMLADDAAVEQVMLGPDGVLAAARPGTTLVDLSSVHPDTSRRIASAARLRDVAVLDAAVSGSTPQAEDGSLVMFVGGERAVYERCRPILDVLATQVFLLGPSGAGATMKLVVNGLLGAGMQALAEALVLGQRAGLEKGVLLDVLEQTSVLAPGHKRKLQNARSESYPVQFALRLMWKDLGNVLRLAQQRAVPMPTTAAAQQACAIEQAKGLEEDFSAVIRTMEELAGLAPPATPNGSPTPGGRLPETSPASGTKARSSR
jgi:3-hydroxyisobutyrate dehydrogenase-like beta-hydroxyacid dehydrogenase